MDIPAFLTACHEITTGSCFGTYLTVSDVTLPGLPPLYLSCLLGAETHSGARSGWTFLRPDVTPAIRLMSLLMSGLMSLSACSVQSLATSDCNGGLLWLLCYNVSLLYYVIYLTAVFCLIDNVSPCQCKTVIWRLSSNVIMHAYHRVCVSTLC